MSATVPKVQAIVLADHIYVDPQTGKMTLIGTFNRLWAKSFPSVFSRPTALYVNLTNIRGQVQVDMRWVDLADGSVLLSSPTLDVVADDPLTSAELLIEVPPFPLPHAGVYAFELFGNDERLGGMRIKVDQGETEQMPPRESES